MKIVLSINLIFEADADYNEDERGWIVTCPMLPGFYAYGTSRDKAVAEAEVMAEPYLEMILSTAVENIRRKTSLTVN